MKTDIINALTERDAIKAKLSAYEISIRTQLSAIDNKVNNLYHVFEFCKLDAVKQAKVSRELTAALRLRRELKEADIILRNVNLNGKDLTQELVQSKTRVGGYEVEAKTALEKILNNQ